MTILIGPFDSQSIYYTNPTIIHQSIYLSNSAFLIVVGESI